MEGIQVCWMHSFNFPLVTAVLCCHQEESLHVSVNHIFGEISKSDLTQKLPVVCRIDDFYDCAKDQYVKWHLCCAS